MGARDDLDGDDGDSRHRACHPHGHSPGATGFTGGGFLPMGRLASGGTVAQTTRKASRHSAPSTTSGHSTPLAAPISAMPLAQFLVPATVGSRRHALTRCWAFNSEVA